MERKPYLNINFRIDFVKTINLTHLEMATFGLFYKGNVETLRNGCFTFRNKKLG